MSFVLRNELNKYVEDVIPHSNRLTEIRLKGSAPTTIINCYAPQAASDEQTKTDFYDSLQKAIRKAPKKGPIVIIGDFNARLQEPDNEEESEWIGEHTFAKGSETTWQQTPEVEENRELLLNICRQYKMLPMNTRFPKPAHKLATWCKPGTKMGDTMDR